MNFLKLVSRGLAALLLVFAGSAFAQQLYGVNPFDNTPGNEGLFRLDPQTGAIISRTVITVPGRTITGAQGLTVDPTTGIVYAIARAAAVVGRLLITLDVRSGAGVEIGNLGDNFSSISFRADGQLFGVTGDGAAVPETLFLINKGTAATTLATALGNGDDGEVIAYHPPSNSFYHWSGNGANVFERISANAPYTVTNVVISPPTSDEVFGAVWDPSLGLFRVTNINSEMEFWSTTGIRSNTQAPTTDDVRGLALISPPTIPTMGEWAMLLLALLMAGSAVVMVRRRNAGR